MTPRSPPTQRGDDLNTALAGAIVLAGSLATCWLIGPMTVAAAAPMVLATALATLLVRANASWRRVIGFAVTGVAIPFVAAVLLPRGAVEGLLAEVLASLVTIGITLPVLFVSVRCFGLIAGRLRRTGPVP